MHVTQVQVISSPVRSMNLYTKYTWNHLEAVSSTQCTTVLLVHQNYPSNFCSQDSPLFLRLTGSGDFQDLIHFRVGIPDLLLIFLTLVELFRTSWFPQINIMNIFSPILQSKIWSLGDIELFLKVLLDPIWSFHYVYCLNL